jgi:hypothetical protein
MLEHISLGVTDLERSRRFYGAALHPLGLVRTVDSQGRGSDYGAIAGQLGVEFTIITVQTGLWSLEGMHLCFRAPNRASVREFHRSCPKCAYENGPEAIFCGQRAPLLQADPVDRPLRSTRMRRAEKNRREGKETDRGKVSKEI